MKSETFCFENRREKGLFLKTTETSECGKIDCQSSILTHKHLTIDLQLTDNNRLAASPKINHLHACSIIKIN